jgi:hypothetical protein
MKGLLMLLLSMLLMSLFNLLSKKKHILIELLPKELKLCLIIILMLFNGSKIKIHFLINHDIFLFLFIIITSLIIIIIIILKRIIIKKIKIIIMSNSKWIGHYE